MINSCNRNSWVNRRCDWTPNGEIVCFCTQIQEIIRCRDTYSAWCIWSGHSASSTLRYVYDDHPSFCSFFEDLHQILSGIWTISWESIVFILSLTSLCRHGTRCFTFQIYQVVKRAWLRHESVRTGIPLACTTAWKNMWGIDWQACWMPWLQQMSHQRWIWGIHHTQAKMYTSEGILPDFETHRRYHQMSIARISRKRNNFKICLKGSDPTCAISLYDNTFHRGL